MQQGLPVADLFQQALCFFFDGTSRHPVHFDALKEDAGRQGDRDGAGADEGSAGWSIRDRRGGTSPLQRGEPVEDVVAIPPVRRASSLPTSLP